MLRNSAKLQVSPQQTRETAVRRVVATFLVVASPVLLAVPADAGGGPVAVPTVVPVSPAPVPTGIPASPDTLAPPAVPAVPAPAITPAVPTPAKASAVVRPVVRTVRAKAPSAAAVDDAAYAARLQADLCQARAVFCGLDRGGRYPAG
jgi:hypothetical protein